MCSIIPCQKNFHETPHKLPNHIHFKLVADDSTQAKRPLSFREFYFKSTYITGFDLSDELSYQVKIPLTTKPEPRPDDTHPWSEEISDEYLYKVAA